MSSTTVGSVSAMDGGDEDPEELEPEEDVGDVSDGGDPPHWA